MTAKRYLLIVGVLLGLAVGLIVIFNRVTDPFWYYRDMTMSGLNAIKPKFRRFERHVKPAIVMREQPVALIFGSSISEIGFAPDHLSQVIEGKGYNFALAGAPEEMVLCDVKFALQHDNALKYIVLGIAPGAQPNKNCTAEIKEMANPDEKAFLFSVDALLASINTISEQAAAKPSHTEDGLYFYTRGLAGTEKRFREYFHANPAAEQTGDLAPTEPLDLGGLQEIIQAAVQKGIDLKIVVWPRHAMAVELEYLCGARPRRWNALAQIATLVESEGKGMVELWDFAGYNALTTEKISEQPGYYWQDPVHFNYEMGNIMLDEIYGHGAKKSVGKRLSPATIADSQNQEVAEREIFLGEHPEFSQQLHGIIK